MTRKSILISVFLFAGVSLGIFAQEKPPEPGASLPAKYDKWLSEEVPYIITAKEREVFLKLQTDKEREFFIESFWRYRDPNPATAENEFKNEHYRRLAYATEHFSTPSTPGWKTDAGRVYIVTGIEKLAASEWGIKMRILEGIKEGASEPTKVVTSSYLQYMISANFQTEFDLAEEQKQIRRVFNLKDVKLLTEADFSWKKGGTDKAFHIFRLDSKEYLVLISPVDVVGKQQFRIEVYEQSAKGKINLLNTEFSIPYKNIAIFGFEDTQGKPYFLSFRILGFSLDMDKVKTEVSSYLSKERKPESGAEAVRAVGEIKPPRQLKQVDPVYPEIARQAQVEGVVILEVTTDIYGRPAAIKTLRSIPLLDQAAIDAVRQWVYEPLVIDGRPRGVIFTVTVRFALKDKEARAGLIGGEEALRLTGGVEPPRLIKQVDPVYPEAARKARVEGIVILEVTSDLYGRPANIKILRSIPLLDQAAIDAVRQWVYEPVVIDGKPKPVTFYVTVKFALDEKIENKNLVFS